MAYSTDQRMEEITAIWQEYRFVLSLMLGAALVLVGIWIGANWFGGSNPAIQDGYLTNLYTELLGVIVTVVIINQLANWRENERLKQQLIRQAGSSAHGIAVGAVDELRANDWLSGEKGLLKGANLGKANLNSVKLTNANLTNALLHEANLAEANLWDADLIGANLIDANLTNANLGAANLTDALLINANLERANLGAAQLVNSNLVGANLIGVHLVGADLSNAYLSGVDLQQANLESANLSNANLVGADFSGANLLDANLSGAYLGSVAVTPADANQHQTRFDETTILPDGQYWQPETDMNVFITDNRTTSIQ